MTKPDPDCPHEDWQVRTVDHIWIQTCLDCGGENRVDMREHSH